MPQIPSKPKVTSRRMVLSVVDDFVSPTITVPPLYLQVNPANMQTVYTKKITRTQTFAAFVEEYWGEDLDTINCTLSTGGFVTPYSGDNTTDGYNTLQRKKSGSYHNFKEIFDTYRNNGNVYDDQARVVKRGNIIMTYSPGVYVGYFNSFDYTESAEKPFTFSFNFSFKVEKSYTNV